MHYIKKILLIMLFCIQMFPQEAKYHEPKLIPPTGHTHTITSVAYSPDGSTIASGSVDKTIKLWDVKTGREIKTLMGHSDVVTSLKYSPDGSTIVSGSRDNTIKFWDVKTGREIKTLTGHGADVTSVAYSPDGSTIASGSEDNTTKIWDVKTGSELKTLSGHKSFISSVAFSPDGGTIASGSRDKTIKIWDVKTGSELKTFIGHSYLVLSVSYSPDGGTIASGSSNTIKLWDVKSGRELKTLSGQSAYFTSVAFSPDGSIIASGSRDNTIKLWDVKTGSEIRTLKGHNNWVYSVAYSSDGRTIASGSSHKTIKLWDVKTGREIKTLSGHSDEINSVAYSPDGRTIALGSSDNTIKLWDVKSGSELKTLTGHSSYVTSIAYSPDGGTIASGSWDNTIKLWDVKTGREIKTLKGHRDLVLSVAYSPDGGTIASGALDNTIKLWDVKMGSEIRSLTGHGDNVTSVAYSPDGSIIASGSRDNTIKLWDVKTGREIRTLKGHSNWVYSVAYSPDGSTIASGAGWGSDNTIKLWDVKTGREIRTLKGHSDWVWSLAYSPDGSVIASGSRDNTIKLWDVKTGREIRTLKGHSNWVHSVAYSPDGGSIASGSGDNTIKLWDMKSGNEIATLIAVDSTDWMIMAPNGLFDASPGAMEFLHFVADNEVIEINQLKERYYEPDLLSKLLGYNKDVLRSVPDFNRIRLTPEVTLKKSLDSRRLDITLNNRGGGIGVVQLFVNNKEILSDIRKSPTDSSKQTLKISVDLYDKALLPHYYYDTLNIVEIKVWNAEHYIISRGDTVQFQPQVAIAKGLGVKKDEMGSKASADLRFYGVFVGVSNYSGDAIDLQFAAKDAQDIGQVMEFSAIELFGKEKVNVTVLSTESMVERALPRKKRIKEVLEALKSSRPQDVVVVYLSGHGATYDDEFYFLTMDAKSISNDPYMKEQSLSSEELTDILNQIPAKKKLVIYDACHSGKGAELLALGVKSVPSSVIRSIEKMKDRSGMLILSGSAADQSSYELGVFGQGVLTRSLLETITRETLRKEGSDNFIDAVALVTKGKEKTEAYATQYNLKQEPKIYGLERTSGFDLGRVTPAVIKSIELPNPRPLFMESVLVDRSKLRDVQKLSTAINEYLTEQSANSRGTVGYTDLSESPIAYQIAGGYTVEGSTITVEIEVLKDNDPINSTPIKITGEVNNKPALAEKIVAEALKITGK